MLKCYIHIHLQTLLQESIFSIPLKLWLSFMLELLPSFLIHLLILEETPGHIYPSNLSCTEGDESLLTSTGHGSNSKSCLRLLYELYKVNECLTCRQVQREEQQMENVQDVQNAEITPQIYTTFKSKCISAFIF